MHSLAAIVYEDGPAFDRFLVELAERYRAQGLSLAGVAQMNPRRAHSDQCDMVLQELHAGHHVLISEHRGAEARGCRLNVAALLEASQQIRQSLSASPDLVIINKFGKMEAEGSGLRDVMSEAVLSGLPTLVGVPQRNWEAWCSYCAGEAEILPAVHAQVDAWLTHFDPARTIAH